MEVWVALVAKIALVKVDVLVEAKSTLQLQPLLSRDDTTPEEKRNGWLSDDLQCK